MRSLVLPLFRLLYTATDNIWAVIIVWVRVKIIGTVLYTVYSMLQLCATHKQTRVNSSYKWIRPAGLCVGFRLYFARCLLESGLNYWTSVSQTKKWLPSKVHVYTRCWVYWYFAHTSPNSARVEKVRNLASVFDSVPSETPHFETEQRVWNLKLKNGLEENLSSLQ